MLRYGSRSKNCDNGTLSLRLEIGRGAGEEGHPCLRLSNCCSFVFESIGELLSCAQGLSNLGTIVSAR